MFPKRRRYLEEAVRIDDENVEALRFLGDAYVANRNRQGAMTQFRRVMKLAPKNGAVAASYGKALLAADSLDGAIVQLTRAKESTPDDPTIYEALGDAFVKHNVVPMVIDRITRRPLSSTPTTRNAVSNLRQSSKRTVSTRKR